MMTLISKAREHFQSAELLLNNNRRDVNKMKPGVYEAIKRFEIELKKIIPEAEAKVIDTFDDADTSLMVTLPAITSEFIRKLVKVVLKIEKETDVTLSTLPTTKEDEKN
jgi:hypothetical protein